MVKGPGLYSEIHKKAKDLLYQDYKGYDNFNEDLLASITVEPAPGLEAMLSFGFPDLKSSKLELQYLDEDGGISASVGLLGNPIMRYSGLMGTKASQLEVISLLTQILEAAPITVLGLASPRKILLLL